MGGRYEQSKKIDELEDQLNDCGFRHLRESAMIIAMKSTMQEFCDDAEKNMGNSWAGVYYKKFKPFLENE